MPLPTHLEEPSLRLAKESGKPEHCKPGPAQTSGVGGIANFITPRRSLAPALVLLLLAAPAPARASLFQGETLDNIANGIAWVALIIAPIIGIAIFWLVHILPEKIAEKKKHPQAHAIQCLCLLSLVFGGLLWPIAWLWAYSKPVLYKMAYGTDQVDHKADESHGTVAPVNPETKTKGNV